jgi:SNF2 family DNA or RNA helicase
MDLDDSYEEGVVADHSSKMAVLIAWIQNCLQLNEKMLIFSQWTATLDVIESVLQKHTFYVDEGTKTFYLINTFRKWRIFSI